MASNKDEAKSGSSGSPERDYSHIRMGEDEFSDATNRFNKSLGFFKKPIVQMVLTVTGILLLKGAAQLIYRKLTAKPEGSLAADVTTNISDARRKAA